jgi:hypothetical protein
MNLFRRSHVLVTCFILVACSKSPSADTPTFHKPAIPAEALILVPPVFSDFSAWLQAGDSPCGPSPDLTKCSERYEVIIERRGDEMYFLFTPKSDGRRISGGGMKYLVDVQSGRILVRSIEK